MDKTHVYHYNLCIHRGPQGYLEISSTNNGTKPLTGNMQQIVEVIRQHFRPGYYLSARDNVDYRLIACVGEDRVIRDRYALEVGRILHL